MPSTMSGFTDQDVIGLKVEHKKVEEEDNNGSKVDK